MVTSEVSKRYAKALLAATKQKGIHSKAFAELQAVVKGFEGDATVKNYFENPMINSDQKVAAVKSALTGKGLSEEVLSAIVLMAEKNRLSALGDVVLSFQDLLDVEEGVTRGVVRSAQPLS